MRDTQNLVTSSAYLLFYRRRSEVPLGGPRFQQILNAFDASPDASEEENAESGEDQSLAAKTSSLRGSSSALTGVGAAHRQTNLGSDKSVNPQDLDNSLPTYQSHESEPIVSCKEIEMRDDSPLHDSIEDEGIDVEEYGPQNNVLGSYRPSFSFSVLGTYDGLDSLEALNKSPNNKSGTGSELDEFADRSDVVQDNSSASTNSRAGRLADWDNTNPEDEVGEPFDEPAEVPDIMDPNQVDILNLHRNIIGITSPQSFKIPAEAEEDEYDEPAMEIHVEEGEGLKMD